MNWFFLHDNGTFTSPAKVIVVLHHKEQLKVYLVTLSSNVASLSRYNRVQHPVNKGCQSVLVGKE